ncbi:hypothetical protein AYO40_06795 [Planctomycetaceae bacterium SCGC AG-212-D15]|nr:hypothetical protein AYO40_06795 [Planctomycetaceae bacterium SCGC AG-212-D15]
MSVFRRVEGNQAGPKALGILLPPGRRTLVVVRPRGLEWDLLPLNPNENGGPRFWEAARIEAQDVAQRLYRALEESASDRLTRVEPLPSPDGAGYEVRASVGPFVLVVCGRRPGQPYQPHIFVSVEEALQAIERLTPVLCPTAADEQEVYLNTRNFAGSSSSPLSQGRG